jgi:hypothetical protein
MCRKLIKAIKREFVRGYYPLINDEAMRNAILSVFKTGIIDCKSEEEKLKNQFLNLMEGVIEEHTAYLLSTMRFRGFTKKEIERAIRRQLEDFIENALKRFKLTQESKG